jgi:glucose-1-phosphate adenylyltransferase
MKELSCAILAGGRGSRLFPLTFKKAKPAVLFGTGYRLIDIPISNAINSKILDISIFTQYYPELLEQHISESFYPSRISPCKIDVFGPPLGEFGEAQLFQGTADALRKFKSYFEAKDQEYILILSGDQLYTMDFQPFLEKAKQTGANLTIACLEVKQHDARRMGVMKIDGQDKIIDFLEKPKKIEDLERLKGNNGNYLASMGIYIFKKSALLELLDYVGDDFGKDLIPRQLELGGVYAYPFHGYWEDIGTIDSFFKANLALIHQTNCLEMANEKYPIISKLHHLSCPLIKDCSIKDSLLAQGTVIKAERISQSIIGLGSNIDEGSQVTNSILLGSTDPSQKTTIGRYSIINNVILDEGVKIGHNVKLQNFANLQNFDGPGIFIRDGITIVQAGTVIPDGYEL